MNIYDLIKFTDFAFLYVKYRACQNLSIGICLGAMSLFIIELHTFKN